jgi:hypothetical protein
MFPCSCSSLWVWVTQWGSKKTDPALTPSPTPSLSSCSRMYVVSVSRDRFAELASKLGSLGFIDQWFRGFG